MEHRRLFASLGYSSLFDYATKELGYCAASACRRIDAMRLLKELPVLEGKIQDGKLTLSTVARAQSFFKKESVSLETKTAVMTSLENKSTREVERELLSLTSAPQVHLQERIKPISPELSEVRFYADDELLSNLEKLKGLLAHSHPNMSTSDLVSYLAQLGLKQLDPSQKVLRKSQTQVQAQTRIQSFGNTAEVTAPAPNESVRHVRNQKQRSRYISRAVAREVWMRDEGRCTWVSALNGTKCGSTYRLQLDHIQAFALGGANIAQNLRLLCFHHNQLEAEKIFGKYK
ncbi:MAG: HNH endonuclease [Bdellovibrionia bacterium]